MAATRLRRPCRRATAPCSTYSGQPATGRWPGSSVAGRAGAAGPPADQEPRAGRDARRGGVGHRARPGQDGAGQGRRGTRRVVYLRLLADAATVAGVTVLTGFDPKQIHVYRGMAKAGLNLSLDRGDEPGHVGWVDAAGKFGVPLDFSKSVPAVQAGLMISPSAFDDEKAMSMRTITRDAPRAPPADHARRRHGGTPPGARRHSRRGSPRTPKRPVVGRRRGPRAEGRRGGQATPRSLPTSRASWPSSTCRRREGGPGHGVRRLLGARRDAKFFTWQQAHEKVKAEALSASARLLRHARQCPPPAGKEWVDDGAATTTLEPTIQRPRREGSSAASPRRQVTAVAASGTACASPDQSGAMVSRPVSGILWAPCLVGSTTGGHPSVRPTRGLPGDLRRRAEGRSVPSARPCSGWGLPSRPGRPGRWCALTAPFHPYL